MSPYASTYEVLAHWHLENTTTRNAFYDVEIRKHPIGDFTVAREWGPLGQKPVKRVESVPYSDYGSAHTSAVGHVNHKEKNRGYRTVRVGFGPDLAKIKIVGIGTQLEEFNKKKRHLVFEGHGEAAASDVRCFLCLRTGQSLYRYNKDAVKHPTWIGKLICKDNVGCQHFRKTNAMPDVEKEEQKKLDADAKYMEALKNGSEW